MHSPPATRVRPALRLLAVPLVCAAALMCFPAPAPAAAPEKEERISDGPVLDHDFPDPDVVEVNGTYHAYATNGDGKHVRRAASADLENWTLSGNDALPTLGGWVDPQAAGWSVWAPEVFATGDGYTMWYTARDAARDRQCIGVARAGRPEGPFTPVGDGPLVCPGAQGGAIDASSYTEGGQRYMLWKNDGNCCGLDTWLHIQPVSPDGTRTTGTATRLIKQDRDWEGGVIEAPTLVRHGSRHVLFYSAGSYAGDAYKTSYATSGSLFGPYTKAAAPLMTTDSFDGTVRGPGGQDVVSGPDGRDRILFHGWDAGYTRRALYVADLGWANDLPVVRGSKVHYEAEHARVNHAVVRDAAGASGGRAVGYIDYPDSFVEFTVFAASAGEHALEVRFGNGSQEGATHTVTVNGAPAGSVTYPFTGWDNWRSVERSVVLTEGWNTIRLGKGTAYAELDAIDVG